MSEQGSGVKIIRVGSRYPEALERVERQANTELTRGHPLTRRHILRTAGGVLLASVVPVSASGCGPCKTTAECLSFITLLIEAAQVLNSVIKGELKLSQESDRCRTYQLALDLFQGANSSTGVAVASGLLNVEACNQDVAKRVEEANLKAQQTGGHIVQTTIAGGTYTSNPFEVNA